MKPTTRRAIACIAGRLAGANASGVYDYSESRHVNFSGGVSATNVNVYDHDAGCQISGDGSSLYHYGNSSHLQLDMSGPRFNGYDCDTGSHFSGDVSGSAVSLYDYGESSYFNYSL